jgi:NAD-dependent SIR2 family protein deacetylase
MHAALPNDAHRALAALESSGRIAQLVTQNVDGLHQAAGHHNVIDLHGRVDVVRCMSCEWRAPRALVQDELGRRNPHIVDHTATAAPDGAAALEQVDIAAVDVPSSVSCGGQLKADLVLLGERVPPERVQRAFDALESADAMLVVGSSLMVYSGYRFVAAMAKLRRPIAAVNLGRTRADNLLTLKVNAPCADALAFLLGQAPLPRTPRRLGSSRRTRL